MTFLVQMPSFLHSHPVFFPPALALFFFFNSPPLPFLNADSYCNSILEGGTRLCHRFTLVDAFFLVASPNHYRLRSLGARFFPFSLSPFFLPFCCFLFLNSRQVPAFSLSFVVRPFKRQSPLARCRVFLPFPLSPSFCVQERCWSPPVGLLNASSLASLFPSFASGPLAHWGLSSI